MAEPPLPAHGSEGEANRFDVRADAPTHFAWLRTRLSVERTLMSWVRTSVSLIGFGFTIFQFFEHLNSMAGVAPPARPQMPRYIAMALIGAGTIGLIVSLSEYRWMLRYLWGRQFKAVAGVGDLWNTPILWVTLLLIAIGIGTFLAVVLRVS